MGKNRPYRSLFTGFAALKRFGATLAMLALAIQCFAIQTHVDARALNAPAHVEASVNASVSTPSDSGAPCLICQELALTGVFLQATPPALKLLEHTLALRAPAPRVEAARIFPAHFWQSRAPPLFSR